MDKDAQPRQETSNATSVLNEILAVLCLMSLTHLTLGRLGQKLEEETQSVALEMLHRTVTEKSPPRNECKLSFSSLGQLLHSPGDICSRKRRCLRDSGPKYRLFFERLKTVGNKKRVLKTKEATFRT